MSVNKSKTYILPYMQEYINLKFINNIINTYLFYNGEYKFCILYKFSGKKAFLNYEDELMSNPYFIKTIDVQNDKVLYVFEIPEDLFKAIELFMDGKYSRLPDKNKIKNFLTLHFGISEQHVIFHVLDRSEHLKKHLEENLNIVITDDLDLSDPPNVDTEEFKLNKI